MNKMLKSKLIEQELEKRDDVTICHKRERLYSELGPIVNDFPLQINFFITPADGLYNAEELQSFMESLVPEIQHERMEYFSEGAHHPYKKVLNLGALFFRQALGTLKTTEELTIPKSSLEAILKLEGRSESEIKDLIEKKRIKSKQKQIYQESTIYVFPNVEIAKIFNKDFNYAYKGRLERNWRFITIKTLNHFNPNKGFLKRLLSR